jgi:hypothetical protein
MPRVSEKVMREALAKGQTFMENRALGALGYSVNNAATVGNHDQQREVERLSSGNKLPFNTVNENLSEAQRYDRQMQYNTERIIAMRDEAPKTAQWLTDPVNARISLDDFDMMKQFEKSAYMGDINTFSNNFKNLGERSNRIIGHGLQVAADAMQGYNDALMKPGHRLRPDTPENQAAYEKYLQDKPRSFLSGNTFRTYGKALTAPGNLGYKPKFTFENFTGDMTIGNLAGYVAEQGMSSAADMFYIAQALPLYLASRTHEIGEARKYNKGELGDLDLQDYLEAFPTAAIVAATEKLALNKVLGTGKGIIKRGAPGYIGEIGKRAAIGFAAEGSQEFGQEIIEYVGETIGTRVPTDPGEAVYRGIQGAIAGGPIGAVTSGVAAGFQAAANRQERDVMVKLRSVQEQEKITNMADAYEQMNTVQQSPVKAAELMNHLDDGSTMYFSAAAVQKAIDDGLNVPEFMVEQLGNNGVDVETSVAQFGTEVLADKPLWKALEDHVKRSVDTLTAAEVMDNSKKSTGHLQNILDMAGTNKGESDAAAAIHKDVVDQLVATGRMAPRVARLSAEVVPEFVKARMAKLKRNGIEITLEKAYEDLGFKVQKGTPEQLARERTAAETESSTVDPVGAIPSETMKQISIKVPQQVDGTVKMVDQSAEQAMADITQERSAYEQLLNCMGGAK